MNQPIPLDMAINVILANPYDISISFLQRKFLIGFTTAHKLMFELIDAGMVVADFSDPDRPRYALKH